MKKQTTRRALVLSVISLFACVAMLVGTTFAWFTDSVTSGRNLIQSGNLDVELYYSASANGPWTKVTSTTDAFGEDNWEPGFTKVVYFKVVNAGSLALKYQLAADVYNETAGKNVAGESFLLSDYLYTAVVDAENTITRDDILAMNGTKFNASFAIDNAGSLAANAEDVVGLAIWMPTSVGNEANHNGTKPSIEFGINLVATQEMSEKDSFGNDYDKDATYPVIKNVTAEAGDVITAGIVKVELPAEATEDDYTLKVDNVSTNTDANGDTTLAFDISLLKDGVAITPVAGVKYPVNIYVGAGLNVTDVKHKGVSVSDFDYDSATGIVSFETDSFSPFEVIYYSGEVTAENFEDLLVKGGEFTLTENLTLDEALEVPAGVAVELDLNGKTITGTKGRDADNNRIHVIVNNGILTIKDGTVKSAGNDGGSAIYNNAGATLAIEDVTVYGAPQSDPVYEAGVSKPFPSYAVNNYGNAVVNGATVKSYHGAIATGDNGVTVINDADIDVGLGQSTGITSYAIYSYGNAQVTVNGGKFAFTKQEVYVNGGNIFCELGTNPIIINGGNYIGASFSTGTGREYVIKGGTFSVDPTKYLAEGYKATKNDDGTWTAALPTVSSASEFKSAAAEGGIFALDGKIAVEDLTYCFEAESTVIGGTLSRDTASGNPLTVKTTEKVTFEGVKFESVKGSTVLATRKEGANIELNNCVFENFGSPSTGNSGVQVYASNVTFTFNNCTFYNMPIETNSSYPDGIKLVFNNCTFSWTGDNCPGMIKLANSVKADIDINGGKFVYTTNSQYDSKKNMISFYMGVGTTTIDFNDFEVIGNRNNENIWKICSTSKNVTVTATGKLSYTFNGEAIDFNTYLQ